MLVVFLPMELWSTLEDGNEGLGVGAHGEGVDVVEVEVGSTRVD